MKFTLTKSECAEIVYGLQTEYQTIHSKPATVEDLIDFYAANSAGLTQVILYGWEKD